MSRVTSTAVALFVCGALLELVGIVFVGSPDLFPAAGRISAWIGRRAAPTVNRLLRLLGRPRIHRATLEPGVVRVTGMPLYFTRRIREGASLVEKVEYLLGRDQEAQERENDHDKRLTALEGETPERLEELRSAMELHVVDRLAAAHRAYLELRIFGAVLLAVGLGCATAANFV